MATPLISIPAPTPTTTPTSAPLVAHYDQHALFEAIAQQLTTQGYSIQPQALPPGLAEALALQAHNPARAAFSDAAIGRGEQQLHNRAIRSDQILWIDGDTVVGQKWLDWASELQQYLNRRLFLGLFSFESHFAHYPPGSFYQRHMDAFRGQSNRVLTLVTYLNHDWQAEHGGALKLYRDEQDQQGICVLPQLGTLVVFLSEEFPHEVLAAQRDRYSIAGWFRVNSSTAQQIDPPR